MEVPRDAGPGLFATVTLVSNKGNSINLVSKEFVHKMGLEKINNLKAYSISWLMM